MTVPLAGLATYVVLHCCNVCQAPAVAGHPPALAHGAVVRPDEHLADYVLVYADGEEHRQAIRRRFEINDVVAHASSPPLACRGCRRDEAVDSRGPAPRTGWGRRQTGVRAGTSYLALNSRAGTNLCLYALANPAATKGLREIRLEATGAKTLAVVAITLFGGSDHLLRYSRLGTLSVSLAAVIPPASLVHDSDRESQCRQFNSAPWHHLFPTEAPARGLYCCLGPTKGPFLGPLPHLATNAVSAAPPSRS